MKDGKNLSVASRDQNQNPNLPLGPLKKKGARNRVIMRKKPFVSISIRTDLQENIRKVIQPTKPQNGRKRYPNRCSSKESVTPRENSLQEQVFKPFKSFKSKTKVKQALGAPRRKPVPRKAKRSTRSRTVDGDINLSSKFLSISSSKLATNLHSRSK
jgi:hypothetical protein